MLSSDPQLMHICIDLHRLHSKATAALEGAIEPGYQSPKTLQLAAAVYSLKGDIDRLIASIEAFEQALVPTHPLCQSPSNCAS